jgi:serine acetyltransferase
MGAVVLSDVPDGQTWFGVPARERHSGGSGGAGAKLDRRGAR